MHIDSGREMRGGQHQVLLLLKALKEAGHQSTLLARENAPLSRAAAAQGFTVCAAGSRQLWQYSREANLVHAHDARAHTMAAFAARCRFVVSRRVAFPVRRSVLSNWKYGRVARYLAVSGFVASELERARIPREKIDVVYDAVEPVLPSGEWSAHYPAVALASRDPLKGRDLIEEAAKIADLRVIFSDDLARDLQRASMFVYITRSEGLGSATLLALSRGVPVIASRAGGLTEVFEDGISGVFVNNEPREIALAMRSILERPGFARRLIGHGRARVMERFTPAHLLSATLLSYERALA